ncbi:hypothetical protein [Streptomyces sp. CB02009]|uniref:hypothetical protein n=1 Tax=Streptomyces sp. CB02009 TaxID=1703938 RepID=UPI0011612356|nr:hypothetical protein [Streptomyces sp. CB02009]
MFWLDRHGYSNILVGDYDPQSNAEPHYSAVTSKISRMGDLMDTGGLFGNGTDPDDAVDGMNEQFEDKGYEAHLEASYVDLSEESNPGRKLAELGAAGYGKNLLLPRLWHYDAEGDHIGGHIVTGTSAQGTTTGRSYIGFNDPAGAPNGGGGDIYTQSPFGEESYELGTSNGDGARVIGYKDNNYCLEGVFVIKRLTNVS